MTISKKELSEMRARCDAATPGRWRWSGNILMSEHGEAVLRQVTFHRTSESDLSFVEHARDDLIAALDEIARLKVLVGELCSSCGESVTRKTTAYLMDCVHAVVCTTCDEKEQATRRLVRG